MATYSLYITIQIIVKTIENDGDCLVCNEK
jgi:hypothetical protein